MIVRVDNRPTLVQTDGDGFLLDGRPWGMAGVAWLPPPIGAGSLVEDLQRVAAAGVFLPISHSRNLPKSYGTRHRAAIGFTEVADAVCLLISEERGTVAVVQGGVVTPVADANDLRQRLQEYLEVSPFGVEREAEVA